MYFYIYEINNKFGNPLAWIVMICFTIKMNFQFKIIEILDILLACGENFYFMFLTQGSGNKRDIPKKFIGNNSSNSQLWPQFVIKIKYFY